MLWIWIVVIALLAYHAWCFHSGRIRFTVGGHVHRRTRWVHKDEEPVLYWALWTGGAAFTLAFTVIGLLQTG
ncbi:MAG: hypothetical protein JRF15_04030 [Deltaproteobacteria bacterium]|jgi:hypothetical protein|nr:hypothetical protein [Deltaproteobacteria bacterium]